VVAREGPVFQSFHSFFLMPQFFCCPQLNGSSKREHAVSDLDFLIWTPGGGGTVIHSFFLLLELSCCFNRPAVSIVLLFPSSCCPQLNGSSKRKHTVSDLDPQTRRNSDSLILSAASIVLLFQLSCC